MVIFTSSCQHAAVNFSQMDTYGFSPNSPSLLRKSPPTKKGEVTMKHIMGSLPSRQQAGVVIATVFDLTRFYPTEVRLCYSTSALSFVALPFQDVQAFKLRCLYLVISNGVDISFKLSKTFSKRVLIVYPKFSCFSFLSILHFFSHFFFSEILGQLL